MNKKTIIIILSVLIIINFGIIYFLLNNNEESFDRLIKDDEITLKKDNIPVYEDIKLSEILDLKNNLRLADDYKINTGKVGKLKLNISYRDDINDKDKKGYLEINIIDDVPPYIGIGDHYSHIINTNFTFYDDIICKDNYDRKIECKIVGDYNIDELGETNLKVVATDSGNNKTEKEFTLKVIEKKDIKDTTPIYKDIKDIEIPENASLMIDVSKWQKDIDWKLVKESGIDYAMIRLGTQKAVDKESVLDTYFEKNIKEAQEVGMKVGVYYFSYANDVNDAKIQAEWVVEQLKDYKIDLPVSFDWECWKYLNSFEINLHELNEMAKTFLNILKDNGYDVVNYGSKNYLEKIWNLDEYDVWLAHYIDKTTYEGNYIMWQFTDKGIVPGINSSVDLDFYYEKN